MRHGIYPAAIAAEFFASEAGKPYRPSNGTEGHRFSSHFCEQCKQNAKRDCQIRAASYAFDVDDADYPSEWTFATDGQPTCTAFDPINADA